MFNIIDKDKLPVSILRIAMGAVFISAAVYRIIFPEAGLAELEILNTPGLFMYPIIALELTCGILMILNIFTKYAAGAIIAFLVIALVTAFVHHGGSIISEMGELFVFDPNPTDVLLHAIYIPILAIFLVRKNGK